MSEGVSICMASFNGENWIQKQIDSIISQINDRDELIIVDDVSSDSTLEIINSYHDERIKLFINSKRLGVNKTFEKAISLSKNDIIFLSDQDDIWSPNKKELILDCFIQQNTLLITSNSFYIDKNDKVIDYKYFHKYSVDSYKYLKNIFLIILGKGNYPGCAMAFKRKILDYALPFPLFLESHDLWVAKIANILSSNYHLEDKIFYRRIHNNNASLKNRPISKKILSRIIHFYLLVVLLFRVLKIKIFT